MPDELLVILGAEATILVFVAAMTLYARRMDVLSGRSFEQSEVSPTGIWHRSRSLRRTAHGLLRRLTRRWRDRTRFAPANLLQRPDITRLRQSLLPNPTAGFVPPLARFRRPATPAADASGRPAVFSEPDRNAAPRRSGVDPERMLSCAAAEIQRSLNARSA